MSSDALPAPASGDLFSISSYRSRASGRPAPTSPASTPASPASLVSPPASSSPPLSAPSPVDDVPDVPSESSISPSSQAAPSLSSLPSLLRLSDFLQNSRRNPAISSECYNELVVLYNGIASEVIVLFDEIGKSRENTARLQREVQQEKAARTRATNGQAATAASAPAPASAPAGASDGLSFRPKVSSRSAQLARRKFANTLFQQNSNRRLQDDLARSMDDSAADAKYSAPGSGPDSNPLPAFPKPFHPQGAAKASPALSEYLQTNAFDRLSATSNSNANDPPSLLPPSGPSMSSSAPPPASLAGFFNRQDFHLAHRDAKIRQLANEFDFKPKINDKSVRMLESKGQHTQDAFYNRVAISSQKHETLQSFARTMGSNAGGTGTPMSASIRFTDDNEFHPQEGNFTFRPAINSYSKQLPARSVDELSTDEARRRHLKLEQLQSQQLREEIDELARQRVAHEVQLRASKATYSQVGSVLQLNSEAGQDSLLDRIKLAEQMRQEQREKWCQLKEESEIAACTFEPHTKALPGYIQQQASSFKEKREREEAERAAEREKAKPDWK